MIKQFFHFLNRRRRHFEDCAQVLLDEEQLAKDEVGQLQLKEIPGIGVSGRKWPKMT